MRRGSRVLAGEPDVSGATEIAAALYQTLRRELLPIGFVRSGDVWQRWGQVTQSVELVHGLKDRERCVFFVTADFKSVKG